MNLIFLDIDGVLNDHKPHPNGYCGTRWHCVRQLNRILDVPDTRLVISSAWRYLVLNGSMTVAGLESLLLTHGVDCYGPRSRGDGERRAHGGGDGSRRMDALDQGEWRDD